MAAMFVGCVCVLGRGVSGDSNGGMRQQINQLLDMNAEKNFLMQIA